jgi:hypothetical protein
LRNNGSFLFNPNYFLHSFVEHFSLHCHHLCSRIVCCLRIWPVYSLGELSPSLAPSLLSWNTENHGNTRQCVRRTEGDWRGLRSTEREPRGNWGVIEEPTETEEEPRGTAE